jgi:hypothetical protein
MSMTGSDFKAVLTRSSFFPSLKYLHGGPLWQP